MSSPHGLDALRPVRARIDLDRLRANFDLLRGFVPVPVMPVVKADAYGHGADVVARELVGRGATRLAVAYVEEAVALRRAGIRVPIVVLAGFAPTQALALAEHGLTPVVSTPLTLEAAIGIARAGTPLRAHVKVDTGMSRLGFTPEAFVDAVQGLTDAGVIVEGVMTHLAAADESRAFTERQLDLFDDAVARLHARGIRPELVHACNSGGLAFFRRTHTLVRPGLLLYGVRPRPLSPDIAVRPVMTVSADVALVKDVPEGTPVSYGGRWVAPRPSRIATIPIGYADGVPRTDRMRESGAFRIGEGRVPVVGTVCMDLTMADVTDRPEIVEKAEAILMGDDPDAWDVATWAGTTSWEALTRVGSRVPRVYVSGGEVVGVWSRFLP
ncbi:MAG TPA: alanine racemase [Vicinamibacteria bacterium]|nr:alanine racemase [Vicinamibacteria bacterium]